tara:strand:- start:6241 stop:7233 length:993 start_codon:yes stop_codon:yes gene_type:complete
MLETVGDMLLNYFSIGLKDKRLKWLCSLAVAQLLLVIVVFWPAGSQGTAKLLFSDRGTEDIIELRLVDIDGESMNLSKQGNDWAMSDADDFPVSVEKVEPLITKLLALKTDRIVATTDNSHIRLEVSAEKYKRKIDIVWADDTIDTLLLGNSAGTGAMHFRLTSTDDVYLTSALTAWDANTTPSRYIDTQYFALDKDNIESIELQNRSGVYVLERNNGKWLYDGLNEGEIFDQSSMDTFLVQVSSIRMVSPLGNIFNDSYGLNDPQAVLNVYTNNEGELQEHSFIVGSQSGDNYIVSASSSEYYALVSSYNGNNLVEKTHSDFIVTSDEE